MTRNEGVVEIRKLRKKLRQIENLELLERDLTDEECLKVSKKRKVRDRLQLLLNVTQDEAASVRDIVTVSSTIDCSLETSLTYSENENIEESGFSQISSTTNPKEPYFPEVVAEENTVYTEDIRVHTENFRDHISEVDDDVQALHTPAQKRPVSPSVREETTEVKRCKPQNTRQSQSVSSQIQASQTQPKTQTVKKKVKLSSGMSGSVFQVTSCVGHNDLVVSVDTDGEVVLSGSRDTTVKYWNIRTGSESHSFGGHTGTVAAVCLLTTEQSKIFCSQCVADCELPLDDQERIGLSGSTDCTLKIWALESGQLIRSIYTFNPITCLQFVAEDHLVIVATGGGKLEMWDVYSGQNLYSHLAHQNLISCLQYSDHHVYSSSTDGEIQVYKYSPKSLSCVYRSEDVRMRGGGAVLCRPVRSLVESAGQIYYGDDGSSLKALDWKEGVVSRFRNHMTEFGSTDALDIQGQTLFSSGYDLDVGLGYVNCRDLETGAYKCTLCDEMSGRIVCLSCQQNSTNQLIMVTGGLELKIWTQLTSSKTKVTADTVRPLVISDYQSSPVHSDLESSGSSAESEDSDYDDENPQQRSGPGNRSHDPRTDSLSWKNWCQIL